jgi:hypothetical protein
LIVPVKRMEDHIIHKIFSYNLICNLIGNLCTRLTRLRNLLMILLV